MHLARKSFKPSRLSFAAIAGGVQRYAEGSVTQGSREASPSDALPSPPLPERVFRQNSQGHRRGSLVATPTPALFLLLLLDGKGMTH